MKYNCKSKNYIDYSSSFFGVIYSITFLIKSLSCKFPNHRGPAIFKLMVSL